MVKESAKRWCVLTLRFAGSEATYEAHVAELQRSQSGTTRNKLFMIGLPINLKTYNNIHMLENPINNAATTSYLCIDASRRLGIDAHAVALSNAAAQ